MRRRGNAVLQHLKAFVIFLLGPKLRVDIASSHYTHSRSQTIIIAFLISPRSHISLVKVSYTIQNEHSDIYFFIK